MSLCPRSLHSSSFWDKMGSFTLDNFWPGITPFTPLHNLRGKFCSHLKSQQETGRQQTVRQLSVAPASNCQLADVSRWFRLWVRCFSAPYPWQGMDSMGSLRYTRIKSWIWEHLHGSDNRALPGTWNSELVEKFAFQQARKEFNLTHSQKEQQSQQEPEDYTDVRDADEETLLKIRKPPTGSEACFSNLHSTLVLTRSGCLAQQEWIQDSFLDQGLYLQFHQHGSLGSCPNSCHHTASICQHSASGIGVR